MTFAELCSQHARLEKEKLNDARVVRAWDASSQAILSSLGLFLNLELAWQTHRRTWVLWSRWSHF